MADRTVDRSKHEDGLLRRIYRAPFLAPIRRKIEHLEPDRAETRALVEAMETTLVSLTRRVDGLSEKVHQLNVTALDRRAMVARDMTNYFEQVDTCYADLTDTFDAYRALVAGLIAMDTLDIVPVCDLLPGADADATTGAGPAAPRLALRHDIDADPITALRMARHLAQHGVPGTFYLLHTAAYYGEFQNHLFIRNPDLVHWIHGLIVAGCEIGMHNDAFGASQIPGVNGASALETELAWVRSHGAQICGTAGHNSAPSYGAENSEVFIGRRLWTRHPVTITGDPLPLEGLSERHLGLTYEGTFARPRPDVDVNAAEAFCADRAAASIRNEPWMRTYLTDNPCCDWAVDVQIWIVGRNQWVIGGRCGDTPIFEWNVGLDDVLAHVAAAPPGARLLVVLHPEYMRG